MRSLNIILFTVFIVVVSGTVYGLFSGKGDVALTDSEKTISLYLSSSSCSESESCLDSLVVADSSDVFSAEQRSFDGIRIYPNPSCAHCDVNIIAPSNAIISIHDVSGRMVFSSYGSSIVPASFLSGTGVYFARIVTERNTTPRVIVRTK